MKKSNLMVCHVFVLAVSMLCLFAGCGKKGLSGLVPGEGVVFYNGEPLEDATITFHASSTNPGARGATGRTDSAGRFRLMTLNPNDGIEPGDYIVTVTKLEPPPPISDEDAARALRGEGVAGRLPAMTLNYLISPKYHSRDTSGLTYTIDRKGDKNIKFELSP